LGKLCETHPTLFGNNSEGTTTEGDKAVTFLSEYGWLNTIDNLTNGRPEKWDFYFNMNIIELLNRLDFHKAKGVFERQQMKKK